MAGDAPGGEAGGGAPLGESGQGTRAGGGASGGVRSWRPWVALVGLLAWMLLAAFTLQTARGPIEADLARQAAEVLARSGESWATARFHGRDATLEGESLAEEARAKVRGSLQNMFGVRVVHDATTLLPERRPFTFSAVKDGQTILLDGYVPSRYALARIVAAAKAAASTLRGQNQLVRARGAPPGDFAGLVEFALDQLKRLPSGRITLSDGALAIEGRAPDLATYEAIAATVQGPLPQGMTLARFAVRPPVASPFFWSASREEGILRVSGYVPSDVARGDVRKILAGMRPELMVHDETRLADGAPSTDMWLKAVRYAADVLEMAPQLRVSLADSAISIEGVAPTFTAYEALVAARAAPPEGFQVTRFAVEPPRAVPFTWRLERTADQVRLTGNVPSEEAKRLLLDAVRSSLPGVPVSDDMHLATGGPPPELWAASANFAVAQVGKLRVGAAAASGTDLVLSGEALDSASFVSLMKALKAPPAGLTVSAKALEPPRISPYVFAVRREGEGLTVSGFYPDESVRAALATALKVDFPKDKLTDVSAIGSGAPSGFLQAAVAGLGALARLASGELTLTDTQLRLTGAAFHGRAVSAITQELQRSVKPPFTVDVMLDVAAPGPLVGMQECQALVSDLLGQGGIQFETGSSRIEPYSFAVLDRVVAVLMRCPSVLLTVVGHTDTVGDAATNQQLSEARAEAVVDFLGDAGLSRTRLSAAGQGASTPVASNETEEGRAQNRRIEFVLREALAP